ncbi:signal peptide-domain containing protein [candidate division GN15 bacterium]|nr:signal peptide-domain containing protein [candidate division GN15 bacterium]
MGIMKSWTGSLQVALAVALVLVLGTALTFAQGDDADDPQQVVVHLSHFSDDLHAVTMSLGLAANMQEQGASVTLMLDLEGPRLADKRQSLDMIWGHSRTVAELYTAFVTAGGTALLCPHCADHAGVTGEHVREGARIAEEGELARLILEADKVVDY